MVHVISSENLDNYYPISWATHVIGNVINYNHYIDLILDTCFEGEVIINLAHKIYYRRKSPNLIVLQLIPNKIAHTYDNKIIPGLF